MKQIVPFVKEIELKNNIEEITSISLDHTLKSNGLNEINGEFSLYFEYKENEISVNTESYSCKIPFNIDLDDRYILKDSNIDIDDFYYEIEDRKVILHIDVLVDNIDIKESEIEIMPRNIDKKVSEEFNDERTIEEEKGDEDGFFLDFNVDGPIMYILNQMTFNGLDKIEELKVKKHYTESLRKKNKSKTRR